MASSDQLFVDAIASLFTTNLFQVVIAGTDYRDCVRAAREERVDLFVIDLHGATENDIQFLLGAQTFAEFRSICITGNGEPLPPGLEHGVDRMGSGSDLIDRAKSVTASLVLLHVQHRGKRRTLSTGIELSEREYEFACLMAKGYTNSQIVARTGMKESSVKNLVSAVIRKLHCDNRVQVALQLRLLNDTKTNPSA